MVPDLKVQPGPHPDFEDGEIPLDQVQFPGQGDHLLAGPVQGNPEVFIQVHEHLPGFVPIRVHQGEDVGQGVEQKMGFDLALVNSRESFESDDSQFMGINRPVIRQQVRLTLTVPFGEYAVKVYHDENGNDRLDTRMFGIPKERFGFSNNARGTLGPPDYSEARFVLDTADHAIAIELR